MIEGLPLDTDFILFVEPVERSYTDPSGSDQSLTYEQFNTPILTALANYPLNGFFKMEAYPDVAITDVRTTRDADSAPGISAAHVFRLTSDQREIDNIIFYINQSKNAPNDAASTALAFNSNANITDNNPLSITLQNNDDLGIFSSPMVHLSAVSGSTSFDWTSALPAFTFSGTSSKVYVDPGIAHPTDGTYTVTAKLTDTKYGTISNTATIKVSHWQQNILPTSDVGSGAGGGCSLQMNAPFMKTSLMPLIALLVGLAIRRRMRS